MKKADTHIFAGMQRDASISKQQPQFLFDAHNIRFTAREGDTLMSITNEKGTKEAVIAGQNANNKIIGTYVGHCVIGDYLAIFTHSLSGDYIFRLKKEDNGSFTITCLTGADNNGTFKSLQLGFNPDYPLQTLGVYENKFIQKVYWTDSINQPRVINIVKDLLQGNVVYNDDSFDFVPVLDLNDSIYVRKIADTTGSFGAGVIQYFVSYYNKYGQESNISCSSSLIPTSFMGKAGSPEEKIGNSFEVTIENLDSNYEYVRVYSLFRSSLNATPACKRVTDIRIGNGGGDENPYTAINPKLVTTITRKAFFDFKIEDDWIPAGTSETENLISRITIPNTNITTACYVFTKDKYPKLLITTTVFQDGKWSLKYITWGNADTIYLTVNDLSYIKDSTYEGYRIFGSLKYTDYEVPADFIIADSMEEGQKGSVTFTDNGTIGDDIDPLQLLYIGGESITAETMEQQSGTLFLGNIKVSRTQIPDTLKKSLSEKASGVKTASNWSYKRYAYIPLAENSDTYKWGSSLNAKLRNQYDSNGFYNESDPNISTAGFKSNEHYRLGVQFQYKTGKWSEPVFLADKIENEFPDIININSYQRLSIPSFAASLDTDSCKELIDSGYVRARAVAVMPSIQDRLVIAQGMLCPSVFSIGFKNAHSPDFQSSWFFRPWPASDSKADVFNEDTANAFKGASVEYRDQHSLYGFNNYGAEIQGMPYSQIGNVHKTWGGKFYTNRSVLPYPGIDKTVVVSDNFDDKDKRIVTVDQCSSIFCVNQGDVTMHSPEFEFNDSFSSLDLTTVRLRNVGQVLFSSNVGTIDIRTSTPPIGDTSAGFVPRMLRNTSAINSDKRLCAGLFYDDYLVDDYGDGDFGKWGDQVSDFSFMVYPWHKTGSLNNDCNRPSGKGTRTSMLERKIISNLKFAEKTSFFSTPSNLSLSGEENGNNIKNAIQLFNSDQPTVTRVAGLNYYGNVDSVLIPPAQYGVILSNGGGDSLRQITYKWHMEDGELTNKIEVPSYPMFDDDPSDFWFGHINAYTKLRRGQTMLDPAFSTSQNIETGIGDKNGQLKSSRDTIRMKYKSSPHAVISMEMPLLNPKTSSNASLYMAEIYREENKDSDFGGTSDEAIKSNMWIPAGEPVRLSEKGTVIHYDYGDTWYQRYDCLKTYAYTNEDTNSIVEIGSFMIETHVNIDGRYDKNRGQDNNLNMSPVNFNLINPVYSQSNNFFNYRILDSDYYNLNEFSSMITWSKQKNNASETDPWTDITLASTLDIDGTKGKITALAVSGNALYAFQENAVAQILFNSRVSIPTSDNIPIEISNSYKVDGERYITTSIGCMDKFSLTKAQNGIYFIDSVSKALYNLSEKGLSNISDAHGFGYWFSQQDTKNKWFSGVWKDSVLNDTNGISLYYDYNKKDLYVSTRDTTLCYSELIGQFTSFLNYNGSVLFNIDSDFHALTSNDNNTTDLWDMFKGEYNNFYHNSYGSDLTFVSNAESTVDKIFTNLEIRADFYNNDELLHEQFFDSIRVWNEYQDTGVTPLVFKNFPSYSDIKSNTKKKFRIWRCDIPRALRKVSETQSRRSQDRIRNTWCKIKLLMNTKSDNRMELHDTQVIYYT